MKYGQAGLGRTFVLLLEDGEILHEKVEEFAREHSIQAAALIAVGGADEGSRLVVGPETDRELPVRTIQRTLAGVHEIAGAGTLFPDERGNPVLHMHIACGREDRTVTGCVRMGVRVWRLLEIILIELVDTGGVRLVHPETGFLVLNP
jgi:predicted DNA-binding protein with PD1-like motif